MKNHLKRIATPRTWGFNRKQSKFILRPNAGGHKMEFGFALGVFLRDMAGACSTSSEAEKLLNNSVVLVNGKRRKDRRYMVGLFDIIVLEKSKKAFEVVLGDNGKLTFKEIDVDASKTKVGRVEGKVAVAGGKIQLRLHNGHTFLVDSTEAKVRDSVVLNIAADGKITIKEVLALKAGARVTLVRGKHIGSVGKFDSAQGDLAKYTTDAGDAVETSTKYLFVVPKGWNNK